MLDATQLFDGALGTGLTAPTGTAVTVTRDSNNILNMLAVADRGAGDTLGLHIDITQTFLTLTSLDIEFKGSTTVGGTYYTLLAVKAIPVAQLIAGAPIFRYAWPLQQYANTTAGVNNALLQFYKFTYTVNGSTATAGALVTYVNPMMDRQQYNTYAENYVAS